MKLNRRKIIKKKEINPNETKKKETNVFNKKERRN